MDKADTVAYDVRINGNLINREGEEYPLLTYRNVTYFPLTWAYAHDSFGWDYQWSEEGLSITSDNPHLTELPLEAWATNYQVAYHDGYYYFSEEYSEENGSKSYRALRQKEDFATDPEEIYDLKSGYWGSDFYKFFYESVNGNFWLKYSQVRHADFSYKIDEDGNVTSEPGGTNKTFLVDDGYLYIGLKLIGGVSYVAWVSGEDEQTISSDHRSYGIDNNDIPGILRNGRLYTLSNLYDDDRNLLAGNQLVCLGYKEKTETVIIDEEIIWFTFLGQEILYQTEGDPTIYACNSKGEEKREFSTGLPEGDIEDHWTYGDKAFVVIEDEASKQRSLYQLSEKSTTLLYGGEANFEHHDKWVAIIPDDSSKFGALIMDPEQSKSLTIGDPVRFHYFADDRLLLKNTETEKSLVLMLDEAFRKDQIIEDRELSMSEAQELEKGVITEVTVLPEWALTDDIGYYDGDYYFSREYEDQESYHYQVYRSSEDDPSTTYHK